MSLFAMLVIVILVALLTLGATSVRAVGRVWMRHWVERKGSGDILSSYLEKPVRLIHAAGTAITLLVFTGGASIAMQENITSLQLIASTTLFLLLVVVVGQLLPRAIARRWSTKVFPASMPLLRFVDILVSPFLAFAKFVVNQILRRRPVQGADAREGIEDMLREGALEDIGATEEMAIISGVVQFGDKVVTDVMTARDDIFALDGSLAPDEVAKQVAAAAYSRVPIYHGSLDNIVGMLHAFDVFREAGERLPPVRQVTITPADRAANELLFEMLRARRQLAIVKNESGIVVGLVTLEDLLEELVGDIRDEHDEPAPREQEAES